jgi:type III secretion protein J
MLKRVLLLSLVLLLGACSSKTTLLRDITERDANEIVAVLYMRNIDATKTSDAKGKSFNVMVAQSELPKAVAALRAVGLPRESRPSLNDVFKSSGFAPTPFEERVRFTYGISQELERTISYMQGVLTARVHVVIPEKSRRKENQGTPSASVFVSYDETVNFELEVPKIRKLVTESIEGLSEDNIQVVITPERVDLTKIVATPVANVAGVRIHQDDIPLFSGFVILLLAALGYVVYTFRGQIQAFAKKHAKK